MVDLLPYLGSDDMRTFVKRVKEVSAEKKCDPPYLALVFKVLTAYDINPKRYKEYLKVRTLTDIFWNILFDTSPQVAVTGQASSEKDNGDSNESSAEPLDILALSYFKEVMCLDLFYPLRNNYLEECIANLKSNSAVSRTIYLMKLMLDTYKKKGDLTEVMNAMNSDFNPKILDYLTSCMVFTMADSPLSHKSGSTNLSASNKSSTGAASHAAQSNCSNIETKEGGEENDKKERLVHILNFVSYLFCYSKSTCFTLKLTEQLFAAAKGSGILKDALLSWLLENALTIENIRFCVGNLKFDDDSPANGGKFTPRAFHFLFDSMAPALLAPSCQEATVAKRNFLIFYRLFMLVNGLKKLLKRQQDKQINSNADFLRSFHATTSFDLL